MAKSKLVQANEKIAEGVVGGFNKIEEGVVGGFNKMADKFVDNYLTKEGETVEEAKERLAQEQKEREGSAQERRTAVQTDVVKENMQKAQNAAADARRKAGLE